MRLFKGLNGSYDYFVHFTFVNEMGHTKHDAVSVLRDKPIKGISDVREIEVEIDKHFEGIGDVKVLNYQLF